MKYLYEFLNEEAKSKSQRRLFGMALAHKRGELSKEYITDEIIELSKLPEKKLKEYSKTKEDDLPSKVDERKTIQVKRKYGPYEPINVGKNAPVRNNILGFISEKGSCTKKELMEYINGKNEVSGSRTGFSWLSKNKKYIIEFDSNGQKCCKLSKLGKRVVNKTNINE